jgi:SAM-dependent methyltransferase
MDWTAGYEEVVGIDIDSDALRKAKLRYPGATFVRTVGESTPFPDCFFDDIRAHVSLPYMDIAKAVGEFHRLLRPGGSIFLSLHSLRLVLRFWLANVRSGNWRGACFYHPYIILNGLLLHFRCRQIRFPFNRSLIESFQTERGMEGVLSHNRFTDISFQRNGDRFAVSARRE